MLPRRALAWLAATWAAVAVIGAGTAAAAPEPDPIADTMPQPPLAPLPSPTLAPPPPVVAEGIAALATPTTAAPTTTAAAPTTAASPTRRPVPARPSTAAPARPATAVPAPALGQQMVDYARTFYGVPYVWGGTSRAGLDCSGLTTLVLQHFGFRPPRTAAAQAGWTVRIPAAQARAGDLVFSGSPATHVGVYVGNGRMIDSQMPGTVVAERPLLSGVYFGRVPS